MTKQERKDWLAEGMRQTQAETAERNRRAEERRAAEWAEFEPLREAIALGEVTREELMAGCRPPPIRLKVGETLVEYELTATFREVPPPAPPPPGELIAFPGAKAASIRTRR